MIRILFAAALLAATATGAGAWLAQSTGVVAAGCGPFEINGTPPYQINGTPPYQRC